MANSIRPLKIDTTHWAFVQGKNAGLAGNTTERGIMAFGLGFAADAATTLNTGLWLAGFDAGALEKLATRAQNRAEQRNCCDDGSRYYAPVRIA
jgi:hypothetical protein